MDQSPSIVDAIEALLFVADSPTPLEGLARSLGVAEGQAAQALEVLQARLAERGAIEVVEIAGGYQLCTKKQFAELVGGFLKPQRQRLSQSVLEVLAIIAYRQPVTLAEVDEVRGVSSDYGLHALIERRFVREVGRRRTPGRPILYGTTPQFLHQFGLRNLEDLPKVECANAEPAERRMDGVQGTLSVH